LDDDNVSNSSITPEEIQGNGLVIRGEPAEYEAFPGDIKYGPVKSRPATPSEMLENDAKEWLGDATEGAIGCKNCGSCTDTKDKKKKRPCCGCVSMDYKWSYADIPSYEDCDSCSSSPLNRQWPYGGNVIQFGPFNKRGLDSSSEDEEEEFEGETTLHQLESRGPGTAGTGKKFVTMCGKKDYARSPGTYPQFPKKASSPWVGIQNGKWDSISRWWGNTSSLCSDWSVGPLQDYDEEWTPVGRHRADYQSMYRHDDGLKIC
jgi:chitinase